MRYVRSRSPSNWRTQSTRCSSTRGPASAPSFVTCPTSTIATDRFFATRASRPATSRTWPTDPAAPVSPAACSVWTESITQTSGRSASSVASTTSRSVSATTGTRSASSPSRSARSRTCTADSSPETYRTEWPAAASRPSAPAVIVDFPIPGEPPRSTSEPGTIPPPTTRSSSARPVTSRATGSASTCASGTGRAAGAEPRRAPPEPPEPPPVWTGRSSTSVFHSPQPGQRPSQPAVSWPHSVHTWTVRAIRPR